MLADRMRLIDGRWYCAQCGSALDILPDKSPYVVLKSAPGELITRTVNVDGKEVHCCTIASLRQPLRPGS